MNAATSVSPCTASCKSRFSPRLPHSRAISSGAVFAAALTLLRESCARQKGAQGATAGRPPFPQSIRRHLALKATPHNVRFYQTPPPRPDALALLHLVAAFTFAGAPRALFLQLYCIALYTELFIILCFFFFYKLHYL